MADGVKLPPSSTDAASAAVPATKEIPVGKADIVSLPPELQELPVAQKLSGEVTAVNKDGSITVRTDKGDITLVPKVPIAEGTKVTVQIPPEAEPGVPVQLSLPLTQSRPALPIVLPQTPIQTVVVDTVSDALDQSAKDFGKIIIPPRFGQTIKAVIYPTPIIMTEDIPDLSEVMLRDEIPVVKPGILPQTDNGQHLSLVEVLQQTEESAAEGNIQNASVKIATVLQNTILKTNDALIRNLLGLPDKPQYAPPSPLIVRAEPLPLIGKTMVVQPQQTSNFAFPVLPDIDGEKPQGLIIQSLSEAIAEFQKAGIKSPQFSQIFESADMQSVSVKIIQMQMPQENEEKAVAPLRILMPGIMPQITKEGLLPDLNNATGGESTKNMFLQTPITVPSDILMHAAKPMIFQAVSMGTVLFPKLVVQGAVQPQTVKATLWATSSGFAVIPNDGEAETEPGLIALIKVESTTSVLSPKPLAPLPNILPQQSGVTGITNALSVPEMILGDEWPAVQQTAEALMEVSAAAARTFLANIPMPTVPPQFTPAVIFFMAALRLGDIKAWTGEKIIETLERTGKSELAKRLGSDFAGASARSKIPLSDGWRPFPIPILYDEHLSRLQLFVRRDGEDDKDGKKPCGSSKNTRFLIDLVLTRIGEIQIDGLVRGRQMDMIVRTKHVLPDDMQQNIRKRFMHASEMTGMNGAIHMYGRGEGWVKVERPAGAPGISA